jgi:hypothetical protein
LNTFNSVHMIMFQYANENKATGTISNDLLKLWIILSLDNIDLIVIIFYLKFILYVNYL